MSVKTIIMNKGQMEQLAKKLQHAEKRKTPPYALYQYKCENCVITAYESGKVVFQGEDADALAELIEPQPIVQKTDFMGFPQAGSDEVGTGDYFGPVVVCACLIEEKDRAYVSSLGVTDSKAMQDDVIRRIAPDLIKRLKHSILILSNADYNRVHGENNMVAIKCKLHNHTYTHLKRKAGALPKNIIIDQFVQEKSYYRYLQGQKEVIKGIHFETKAENKYLSVAAASVIARYAFLDYFDRMSKKYEFEFPKGAGHIVDAAILRFVKQHGEKELYNVAKLHFANTKKALSK